MCTEPCVIACVGPNAQESLLSPLSSEDQVRVWVAREQGDGFLSACASGHWRPTWRWWMCASAWAI